MSVALSPLTTLECTNPALSVKSSTPDSQTKIQLQKNRFYMELTAQRAIPKDSELTIRYTSAFEVSLHLLMEGFDITLNYLIPINNNLISNLK